ncbi:hypothetical protein BDV95DRAFT_586085 [Massariosphaeria phaeospora]|uniref:Uncharacterized protein n=1 Tax=Massariosphaeria phaeospora TaxID=100035 RepID=A0A7C8M063_9PLEO|nr:hypothetical protein BDV95DRAFT_586085 [Massariosphaeria phaeospora]
MCICSNDFLSSKPIDLALVSSSTTPPTLPRPATARTMLDSASVSTVILLAAASALLLVTMLYPSSLLRWLQRKRYQYEVTFSLYMLTTTEKFIFNSVLFLLLSLLIIAASLYLPEHIVLIANRMFYYFSGDEQTLTTANKATHSILSSSHLLSTTATQFLGRDALVGQGRAYMEA